MSAPMGTTASTGEACPGTGVWQLKSNSAITRPLREGERMPQHEGQDVTWELMRAGDPLDTKDFGELKERIKRG